MTSTRHYKESTVEGTNMYVYSFREKAQWKMMASLTGCDGVLVALTLPYYPPTLNTFNRLVKLNNAAYGDSPTISSSDRQAQEGEFRSTTLTWTNLDDQISITASTTNLSNYNDSLSLSYYNAPEKCRAK